MASLLTLAVLLLSSSSLFALNLQFEITENSGAEQLIGEIPHENAINFRFGALTADHCNRYFIVSDSGRITTLLDIDREEVVLTTGSDELLCYVLYTQDNSPRIMDVNVVILDENDNKPNFFELNQPELRTIIENIPIPAEILRLEAVDSDAGHNGMTEFYISDGNEDGNFLIGRPMGGIENSKSRVLFLNKTLPYDEQNSHFNLTIVLRDLGDTPNLVYQNIIIDVLDSQDTTPAFAVTNMMFSISENHPVGLEHPFQQVRVVNPAIRADYSVTEGPRSSDDSHDTIGINMTTGELYLLQPLNHEILTEFNFYIHASNPDVGASDEVFCSFTVVDVNDNSPIILRCSNDHDNTLDCSNTRLVENSDNLIIAQIYIQDHDRSTEFKRISANISFITSDPNIESLETTVEHGPFSLLTVSLPRPLDRELVSEFTLELTLFNEAEPHLNVSQTISVTVLDENDNPPIFEQEIYSLRIAEGGPDDKEIVTMHADDPDIGENGTVTFSILSAEPSKARNWFQLSPSGVLIVSSDVNYTAVDGMVNITISATDNGTNSLTSEVTAQIEISPSLTFTPNSYAQFAEIDIVNSNLYTIYLEVRTKQSQGVLLFQAGGVSLELRESLLEYRHGDDMATSRSAVSDNQWYSVLITKGTQLQIEARKIGEAGRDDSVIQMLQQSSISECSTAVPTTPFYIGGINLFSLGDDSLSTSHDFVGTIRSVLINGTQLDLGCPSTQVNTIPGFFYSDFCGSATTSLCENDHTTGCVEFAPEPYCACRGGFPPASCQPITDADPELVGSEDSFAPIRFHANTKADLTLDYSFFSDLQQARSSTSDTTAPPGRRRRLVPSSEGTIQTVAISFKMVDVHTSVLLFSRTPTTINTLKINVAESEAITYTVEDIQTNSKLLEIRVELELENMTLYDAQVTISGSVVLLSIYNNINGMNLEDEGEWIGGARSFVEQPTSTLGIGGAEDMTEYFEGCISRLAIDSIEIPLSGLLALSPDDGGFLPGGNATTLPDMYCDLCDLTTCQNDSHCVREVVGEPICECDDNFELSALGECIADGSTLVPLNPLEGTMNIVIGASVGGGVVIITLLLVIILIRVCRRRRDKQKRTYSVTNVNGSMPDTCSNNSPSTKPNEYVHTQLRARDSLVIHTTPNGTPRHDRGSSVSTFQEHAEDGDPDFETMPRRSSLRRKSTASAESGIKTDTEMSYPRMEDSGNEKETDYSEHDSVSDDLSSTFYPHSAIGIAPHLMINSPPASSVSSPHTLTPKERQIITPLRPASTALSASEFEGGDTDVEVFHFGHHTLPASLSRNSSGRRSGRIGSDSGGDTSRVSSVCSSAKWYKASTASDAERERERSIANRAFYTQRSEPMSRYSEDSDYPNPPTFQPKSAGAVPYPNTRRSRMPINLSESPISRTEEKPDMYPHPYTASKPSPAHNPRLSYDNHRLKHEYSLPKGHPNIALSTTSSSSGRPRHNADAMLASGYPVENTHYPPTSPAYPPPQGAGYPRFLSTSGGPGSSIPHHTTHFQYSRSEDKTRKQPEQRFQDLKSVAKINPIAYWEMQDRMNKTAVDQVDPYHLLSEPYVQFEDVSTDPSVIESQITQDGPEHQHFCSQGGVEITADMMAPQLSMSGTIVTETDSIAGHMIPVFPSADCSSQYTATLEADSTSGDSTPKTPNVFAIPTHYDV